MTHRIRLASTAVLLAIALSACGVASADRPSATLPPLISSEAVVPPTTVVADVLVAIVPDDRASLVTEALTTPGYETVHAAWEASDLRRRIAGQDVTVLAPSERMFQALPQDLVRNLLADVDQVNALLARHVLIGVYSYDQLATLTSVTTLAGDTLPVRVGWDGVVLIDESPVQMPLATTVTGLDGQHVAVYGYGKVLFDLG